MANRSKQAPDGSVRQIDERIGKDSLAALINERYEQSRKARLPFEREWLVNIAFLQGNQYVYYDTTLNRLVTPEQPEWRVRITINRIRPIVKSIIAKILRGRPVLHVLPNTMDDEDIAASKVGKKFLASAWRDLKLDEKEQELVLWAICTGKAFVKTRWNPQGGQYVEQPQLALVTRPVLDQATGQTQIDSATGEMQTEDVYIQTGEIERFWTGEIEIDVIPAFEIFNETTATSLDNSAWVIHAKWRPLDWIRDNFPENGHEVSGEKGAAGLNYSQSLLAGITASGGAVDTNAGVDGAVVKEYYERPNKAHPKGRLITVANDVVLQDTELPSPDGGLPFVEFDDIPEPGRFWSTSRIKDMIPLQVEYNKTRSQALENKNLMQRPKWLVRNGSLVDQSDALTDQPGEVVFYTGDKPEAWFPPAAPDYSRLVDQINFEFMEISGQFEVSKGSPLSSQMPGIAIQLLQEADDTKLGPIISRYHRCLEDIGSKILALAGKYYEEPRLIKTVGSDNCIDVDEFIGADLHFNYDVRIESGNAMGGSLAGKRQFILDLWGIGLFGPYQTPEQEEAAKKVLMYLEFGDYEQQFDNNMLDESNAKQENKDLLEGKMPQRQEYDDDLVHAQVHARRLKQADWPEDNGGVVVQVPQIDPATGQQFVVPEVVPHKEALLLHWQEHLQRLAPPAQQQPTMAGEPPVIQEGIQR
jgi:hypothetical protein